MRERSTMYRRGAVTTIRSALQRVSTVERCRLAALDGPVGRVCDLYFETPGWNVRHLVVRTERSRVLIPPTAVRTINLARGTLIAGLTRAEIESSPPAERDKPVSEQHRPAYGPYLGFPSYWRRPYRWARGAVPATLRSLAAASRLPILNVDVGDPHLRSARALHGYSVQAVDGTIGHVADFIVNLTRWTIPYLVVDSHHVWAHRYVLIPTPAAGPISWEGKLVHVSVTCDAAREAPEFDPTAPIEAQPAITPSRRLPSVR